MQLKVYGSIKNAKNPFCTQLLETLMNFNEIFQKHGHVHTAYVGQLFPVGPRIMTEWQGF